MDVPSQGGMMDALVPEAGRPRGSMRLSGLLFAAALSACTVGPDFVKPKAEVPAGWVAAAKDREAGFRSTLPASSVWWESFHDPELTSLIGRAAAANLDLRESAIRIVEARAQRDIAAGAGLPTVAGNASYANTRISETTAQGSVFTSLGHSAKGLPIVIPAFPNPYDQYQVGFDASWEPDLFGGVRRSVEAAEADAQASQEDDHAALVSLEAEVARNYIDLRSAQAQLAIAQRNLATERRMHALAQQRYRAGLVAALDASNAQAEVLTSQSQLPPLGRTIVSDMDRLSELLACEPGALKRELNAAQPVPSPPSEVPIGLPGDLLRRRPDIRAAEERLHAATARAGVAVAELFPSLTLNASLGSQSETFPDLAQWASRFYSIGPSLEFPIFEGGKLRANVRLADLEQKQAAVDYARTVLAAVHEVENAIVAYGAEQNRRDALRATLAQNRDTLALARQRYKSGLTGFLDVLDADRGEEGTELALAQSNAAVSTDLVALYKALGGGWNVGDAAAAK